MKKKDFEAGKDKDGNQIVFIEERHFENWFGESFLDNTAEQFVKLNYKGEIICRLIKNGVQKNVHCKINSERGEIINWL
jgi:hypothetical protein